MAGVGKSFNFLFILALILGIACIFLIFTYVKQVKDEATRKATLAAGTVKVEKVSVLIANQDLELGQVLEEGAFKVVQMPKDYVPETALKAFTEVGGRLPAHFIPQGDIILDAKLKSVEKIDKVSRIIPPGKRLVSVSVSETKAASYLVKNGDYVDLIGLFVLADTGRTALNRVTSTTQAFTFLQKVKVFDIIHGSVSPAAKKGNKDNTAGRKAIGTTITFEVSPKEAEIILVAEARASSITYVLRRYDDEERFDTRGTSSESVLEEYLPAVEEIVVEEVPAEEPEPVVDTRRTIF
ncbi:MAG: Flp pilus assembly protein CpaB [Verrucomicrobiota bacterium]